MFFSLVCFAALSGQVLDYQLYNSSTTKQWNFGMDDAGPFPAIYELSMQPSTRTAGSIPLLFAFPLEWKAEDSNGCGVYEVIMNSNDADRVATTCAGTTVSYQMSTIIPFVKYKLEMRFD